METMPYNSHQGRISFPSTARSSSGKLCHQEMQHTVLLLLVRAVFLRGTLQQNVKKQMGNRDKCCEWLLPWYLGFELCDCVLRNGLRPLLDGIAKLLQKIVSQVRYDVPKSIITQSQTHFKIVYFFHISINYLWRLLDSCSSRLVSCAETPSALFLWNSFFYFFYLGCF